MCHKDDVFVIIFFFHNIFDDMIFNIWLVFVISLMSL